MKYYDGHGRIIGIGTQVEVWGNIAEVVRILEPTYDFFHGETISIPPVVTIKFWEGDHESFAGMALYGTFQFAFDELERIA